jgi:hypothetical protein
LQGTVDKRPSIVGPSFFLMLTTRFMMAVCRAGMYRRPIKQYDGGRMGQPPRESRKYIRAEATKITRERDRRASRSAHKSSTLGETLNVFNVEHHNRDGAAKMAGCLDKVYLCVDRWVGKRRGSTGLLAIQKTDFDRLHTYMFNSEILKSIVDFRLEYRRVNLRDIYNGESQRAGEAQVDAFVLVPSDDRVTLDLYYGCNHFGYKLPCRCRIRIYRHGVRDSMPALRHWLFCGSKPGMEALGKLAVLRRRFRRSIPIQLYGSLRRCVSVMYDGIEVAIIEEGGRMMATKEGIHLGRCRYAHNLHRMDEASRLHQSRLCDDLFAQVMAYVG